MRQPMLRSFMVRHGAHQVNRSSLSGSSVRCDVDEPLADDAREQLALLRPRADLIGLALLRVDVAFGERHVQVAAQDQSVARLAPRPRA